MSDAALSGITPTQPLRPTSRLLRLAASPAFQRWAARFPLTRPFVRHEGAAMFDLVAGFCHAQVLQAVVKLGIPDRLLAQELPPEALAQACAVPPDRMSVLLQAATALRLVKMRRNGCVALTMRGAALAGVPGLQGMIAHHDVLYRDLSDPVAFFRGETETELADFWPYVFGAGRPVDADVTARYSQLMSDSQALVAEDTLATISLKGARRLMDVGGGTGAFLGAVAQTYPDLQMTLFDLPGVSPAAAARFEAMGARQRLTIAEGSFRDDPLPEGADVISLIRVLYDHADDTVQHLLRAVYDALPEGGRLFISEPMTGGANPTRAGDGYFALYCMAMRTGRARSADEISRLVEEAGFTQVHTHRAKRAYVTSVISAVRRGLH